MMAFRTLSNRFAPFKAGMLAPIYGWFTEGFDTRDLKEAKALLESWRRKTPLRVIWSEP
jgi:hypothetical protein